MQRLWLIFAQTVTVGVALLFIVATFHPEWLGRSRGSIVALTEAPPPADGELPPASFRAAAKKAVPAVVHIFTSKATPERPRNPLFDDPIFKHFFGDRFADELDDEESSSSLGSGVLVSPDGTILTNYHVVEAASDIEVAIFDGRKFSAQIVGSDPESDLAVVRIKGDKLPAMTFGSMDGVGVGDVVLAIGNPFGVGQTVTMGIISALGRSHLGINTFENFIQTDAAINPGNSGGALIDTQGNLIGINTAIFSQSGGSLGIGFAIPVSSAKSIMEQIVRTGTVTRGWIGVEAQELTPELAASFGLSEATGALIAGVLRGSPADRGGIRPGDILLSVNGRPVTDPQSMLDLIAALTPEQKFRFRIHRNGEASDLEFAVGKRPPVRRERNERG